LAEKLARKYAPAYCAFGSVDEEKKLYNSDSRKT